MVVQEYYEEDDFPTTDYTVVIEHAGKTAKILLPKSLQDFPWGDEDAYGLNMVSAGHYE